MSRILALDFGSKRVGIALSDSSKTLASPYKTLENKGKDFIISEIKKICNTNKIEKIVIGIPISLSGKEKAQARKVRAFARFLAQKVALPIVFEDERFTSVIAIRFLKKIKKKKMPVDQIAAQIILQNYLDKLSY